MAASKTLTPEQRSLRSRLAGLKTAATHDTKALTAPARAAFDRRFEDIVDPKRELSEKERARRVEAARKAHFTKLAYASSRARSRSTP